MGVPKDVRDVPRPKNTIVVMNKTKGPYQFAVRKRNGTKYVPGGNPQPINGEVIGYIYNGKFIPKLSEPGSDGPSSVSYGASALAIRESEDIMDDLLGVMGIESALFTYVVALIKTVKPGVKGKRLSTFYRKSFIGQRFKGININSNTATQLYRNLGMDKKVRTDFAKKRLERLSKDAHLIVDGMLKEDNSTINDLSGFSSKSRTKGIKNISIIYAYDPEKREIICSEVFPGGFVDSAAYSRFIQDNDIQNGILITDKGFPPSQIRGELEKRPGLHFLTPLKRNDPRISSNQMLKFEGILKNTDEKVTYKKVRMKGGNYLYSFWDPKKAFIEEKVYLGTSPDKEGKLDSDKLSKKREQFGTIVFLSDVDMTPEEAYACYSDRWIIELAFKLIKNDLDIHTTDVQDDYTVIGEEFVNTIASMISCRILNIFRDKELMEDASYGDLMEDLSEVWRTSDAPEGTPDREDKYWVHPFEYALDLMIQLDLCTGQVKGQNASGKKSEAKEEQKPEEEKVKRPRGRPRKNPIGPEKPKRPRGRPRKNPPVEDAPKRPRGRPRKNPV